MSLSRKMAVHALTRHPRNSSVVLENLPRDAAAELLKKCSGTEASAVITRLSPHAAKGVLVHLEPEHIFKILGDLPVGQIARLIRGLDPKVRDAVVETFPKRVKHNLRLLLSFKQGTAGALMDPAVLALNKDLVIRDALEQIRENPELTRYNVYVVEENHLLVGVVNLRELFLAKKTLTLSEVMTTNPYRISSNADRATITTHPGWREAHSVPVVDDAGAYLGALRYRTFRELEEARSAKSTVDSDAGAAFGQVISTAAGGLLDALAGNTRRDEGDGGGH